MIDLVKVGKGHPAERPYLQSLYELVLEIKAQSVLEIGTGKYTFSRAILKGLEQTGGRLYTCDPGIEPSYVHEQMSFYPISSDSLAKTWRDTINLLMIDGDHSKTQVAKDYYNFRKYVATPGLIAFHDINIPHARGIGELWNHLKKSYPVRMEHSEWPGFGVLSV